MSNHSPMMGCFNPGCPQCYKTEPVSLEEVTRIARGLLALAKEPMDTQSPYVRYHEIGNRPEKPKPPVKVPDACADGTELPEWFKDNLQRTLEALRISQESKTTPRTYPYPFGQSLTDFEKIAKICGCADCQRYLKSKEINDMPPLTYTIDINNISSKPSPEQLNLTAIAELTKNDPAFARKVKETAEKAEREHKENIQQALKSVNFLAMKAGHDGRDFCISFWRDGEAHSLDGTDYAYGQDIKEDDVDDENCVFVSGSVWPVSGTYATMDRLKERLERNNVLYVIEYYPGQD